MSDLTFSQKPSAKFNERYASSYDTPSDISEKTPRKATEEPYFNAKNNDKYSLNKYSKL